MSYAKEIYCGNITSDLDVKVAKTGTEYLEFSLVVDTGYGDSKRANFLTMVAFGKTATTIAKYFKKGSEILVESVPSNSIWKGSDGKNHYDYKHTVEKFAFTRGSKTNDNVGDTAKVIVNKADDKAEFMDIPADNLSDELPFI